MTFESTLLIALTLMLGWAVQEHRRRRQLIPLLVTVLVSLTVFVLAIGH